MSRLEAARGNAKAALDLVAQSGRWVIGRPRPSPATKISGQGCFVAAAHRPVHQPDRAARRCSESQSRTEARTHRRSLRDGAMGQPFGGGAALQQMGTTLRRRHRRVVATGAREPGSGRSCAASATRAWSRSCRGRNRSRTAKRHRTDSQRHRRYPQQARLRQRAARKAIPELRSPHQPEAARRQGSRRPCSAPTRR